jgi:hypothetical protein
MKRTKSRLEKKLVKAIEKMCKECIYDPGNGSWREQVEECPSFKCPLYTHRPTTKERII